MFLQTFYKRNFWDRILLILKVCIYAWAKLIVPLLFYVKKTKWTVLFFFFSKLAQLQQRQHDPGCLLIKHICVSLFVAVHNTFYTSHSDLSHRCQTVYTVFPFNTNVAVAGSRLPSGRRCWATLMWLAMQWRAASVSGTVKAGVILRPQRLGIHRPAFQLCDERILFKQQVFYVRFLVFKLLWSVSGRRKDLRGPDEQMEVVQRFLFTSSLSLSLMFLYLLAGHHWAYEPDKTKIGPWFNMSVPDVCVCVCSHLWRLIHNLGYWSLHLSRTALVFESVDAFSLMFDIKLWWYAIYFYVLLLFAFRKMNVNGKKKEVSRAL